MALHVEMEIPSDPALITAALEGLAAVDYAMLTGPDGGRFPPLYESGVVYRRERPGHEDWQTADRLLENREGDCEDLSSYRAAELRRAGESARPIVVPTAVGTYHAVVERADGSVEDPSRILIAMEEQMKLTKRPKAKIGIKRVGNHYVGAIDMPLRNGGSIKSVELGFDPFGAISSALHSVYDLAQKHPEIVALLSPEAAIALKVTKKISDMSPEALKLLIQDDRTTDAQKELAKKVLAAKAGSGAQTATPASAAPTAANAAPVSFWAQKQPGAVGAEDTQRRGPARGGGGNPNALTLREHRSGTARPVDPNAPPPAAEDPTLARQGLYDTTALAKFMREHGQTESKGAVNLFTAIQQSGPSEQQVYLQRQADAAAAAAARGVVIDTSNFGKSTGRAFGTAEQPLPGTVYVPDGQGGGAFVREHAPPRQGYPGPQGYPGYPGGSPPFYQPPGGGGLPASWYGDQGVTEPLMPEDEAALSYWGAQAFAEGAYPGYQVEPSGQWWAPPVAYPEQLLSSQDAARRYWGDEAFADEP